MSKIKNLDFGEVLGFFKDNPESVLTPGKSEENNPEGGYTISRIKVNTYAEVLKNKVEIWTKSQIDLIFVLYMEDFLAARLVPVPTGHKLMLCFSDGEIMTFWVNSCS